MGSTSFLQHSYLPHGNNKMLKISFWQPLAYQCLWVEVKIRQLKMDQKVPGNRVSDDHASQRRFRNDESYKALSICADIKLCFVLKGVLKVWSYGGNHWQVCYDHPGSSGTSAFPTKMPSIYNCTIIVMEFIRVYVPDFLGQNKWSNNRSNESTIFTKDWLLGTPELVQIPKHSRYHTRIYLIL